MAIDMSQFYQVFFEESAEHLAAMESLLLDLDICQPDPEQLNAIFRAAHSIKGSSGTFGFSDLAETTHILENLLDKIRKQELVLTSEMVDAFLEAGDLLKSMLAAHQGDGDVDQSLIKIICTKLKALSVNGEKTVEDDALDSSQSRHHLGVDVGGGVEVEVVEQANVKGYDIQFIPNLASVESGAVSRLLSDYRLLGSITIVSEPDTGQPESAQFWHLKLRTNKSIDYFSEHLDFISDSGAWRVSEDRSFSPNGNESFGFFSDVPGLPEDELGYGFFGSEKTETVPPSNIDESYGFFEPIDAIKPQNCSPNPPLFEEDGNGQYGFFLPVSGVEENSVIQTDRVENVVVELGKVAAVKEEVPSSKEAVSVKAASKGHSTAGDSSIRVSIEKVDQLINLVGELVITQAMLLQTSVQMQEDAPERLINGLAQLERNTRDLQESVMSIRMMPISFVFSRFPRVIRDLSAKLGKQVELKTSGETTELDKSLIERIADPLTHLIRNSLDHGIESPELRVASGKNPVGTITLRAYHQGGNIVIEVGDDGAGLPRQKILKKAKERGLQVSDQMTDQEVFGLIFEAGFSTAEQVTDVSGRGVGMDVVRKNIQAMGGRVEIESMAGIGTRMTVRLPLTLAILDGMSVAVGDQTYILPLSYVVESLQPQPGDIKTLSNQARVMQVRGDYLPVVVLHEIFGIKPQFTDFSQGIMVVLDADGLKAALFVDALVGQHQVVIKSLEANYRRVSGISGATIMGDGHVALILDVSAIAGLAKSNLAKVYH